VWLQKTSGSPGQWDFGHRASCMHRVRPAHRPSTHLQNLPPTLRHFLFRVHGCPEQASASALARDVSTGAR
jgi:hypothetical protein